MLRGLKPDPPVPEPPESRFRATAKVATACCMVKLAHARGRFCAENPTGSSSEELSFDNTETWRLTWRLEHDDRQ